MERIDRFRRRECWPKDSEVQKVYHKFGAGLGHTREQLEDGLLLIKEWTTRDATREEEGKVIACMRQSIRELSDLHKLCFVGATHGNAALLAMASKKADPDFTEEEEKALAAVLKEQGEGGGKAKGKQQAVKPYSRPGEEEGASMYGIPMMQMARGPAAAGWGWGRMPYLFYAAGYGAQQGWGPGVGGALYGYSEQGGSRAGSAGGQGYAAATKLANNGAENKFPCDNCGSTDHWKSSFNCPNYHIHLSQLAAKAELFRTGGLPAGAGAAVPGSSTALAVPAKKGKW